MMKHLKSVISLTAICGAVAILLAMTNFITAPVIEKNAQEAASKAMLVVLPSGEDFQAVDLSAYELPATVTEAYTEKNGGVVVKLTTSGYGSGMVVMVGIDANGTVTGATCLASNETLSYEKTYGEKAIGLTADTVESDLEVISGATKTTGAYKGVVVDALNTAIILGGGSVDVRSEEQILADNLSAALPAGEGGFEKLFVAEKLDGASAVYKATNGAGYVFVSGESFVGTDAEGKAVSEADEALKAQTESNAALIIASEISEIDISGYELPSQIEKAYRTATGNFVFDLKAAGFGINGDEYYYPSGEHIKIKASVTADGTIIACETTYQSESEGIGSACADASFYSQFDGKTAETYKDIEAIGGATITTNGYKTAVSKVFEAVEILKGEAK